MATVSERGRHPIAHVAATISCLIFGLSETQRGDPMIHDGGTERQAVECMASICPSWISDQRRKSSVSSGEWLAPPWTRSKLGNLAQGKFRGLALPQGARDKRRKRDGQVGAAGVVLVGTASWALSS